jgi:hypothetical protein
MSRTFDAYVLPRGIEPPPRPGLSFEAGALEVRFGDWDPAWVAGLAVALAARSMELAARGAAAVLESLARAGARLGDPRDPMRRQALELLPPTSGLSPAMATAVLDGMAVGWREGELRGLVEAELGCVDRLDGFIAPVGVQHGQASPPPLCLPVGPRLCVQIVSGSVPGVGVSALVRSLLVKGPTLLKTGRGDVVLPVLFARALREVDPELADALAVIYWPGGSARLEEAAIGPADVVVAYGSDETVRAVRDRTPVTARFVAYHHRLSVGVVGREALAEHRLDRTASEVARAVALFDQRGCVSPQVVWVEEGGGAVEGALGAAGGAEGSAGAGGAEGSAGRAEVPAAPSARVFARRLAGALQELEGRLPGGVLEVEEASAVQQLRGTAEIMAASGSAVEVIHGGGSSWTVVYEAETGPPQACVGRVVRVRPLASLDELPQVLEPVRHHLQTVGTAGLGARADALAAELGRLGASRVVPFASVAFPPARWHHDGGRPLGDLVRWVDLERE